MIFPIEEIWKHYGNKYKAINVAALYARKIKDDQIQGLIDKNVNPIIEALIKCKNNLIRYKGGD
jgi:DNA-directed RNA polymerase subunit K/omega|uniref:DNA-directed RNA polymerase subunit omega n=1 Tax=candidate division WOR-3 bacterium TaxID=2052148 RepID=A0A7V3RHP1_UNCW3